MARHGWYGRGFTIRRRDLDEACAKLGVIAPVEVKLTRYDDPDGTVGRLIGFVDGTWRIALDTYLPPAEASRTTYHELGHVLQAQRLGGMRELLEQQNHEFSAARLVGRHQRRLLRGRAIARTPLEREAEQLARTWHKQFPIAHGTRTLKRAG